MKYKILILFCYLFLVACQDHNIPIANLEFDKFEKESNSKHYFYLHFYSDVELIESLHRDLLGGRIECFFIDREIIEDDFTDYKGYALCSVGDLELLTKTPTYKYKIESFFKLKGVDTVSANPTISNRNALNGAIQELKEDPNCISCVVTSVTMLNLTKRYISNTMCVPKSDLLEVID